MLKLHVSPEVKNKNQKQSSWTALIGNHPLPPSPSLLLKLLVIMAVLVWRGNLLKISLCTLAQHHQPSLPYLDFHCYSQILKYWDFYGVLFSHTPCLDLSVFWKCLDFQKMLMWRGIVCHQGVLSLFPMDTWKIGKYEQRAKALVIFKEG